MARKTSIKSSKVAKKAAVKGGAAKAARPRKAAPKSPTAKAAEPKLLSGGNPQVEKGCGDGSKLPPLFPTHRHSPQFWEQLGRTIATYGFLEEILGKAIFAFTATRDYSSDKIEAAYQAWLPQLERALTDQLWNLAESYGNAARDNPATTTENVHGLVEDIVEDIKKATVIRNVLCHGSWRTPNASGASVPLFFNRQKQVFDTAIDIGYLKQVQTHVAKLACSVIDSVTRMGWQFPGGAGPGKPIMGEASVGG